MDSLFLTPENFHEEGSLKEEFSWSNDGFNPLVPLTPPSKHAPKTQTIQNKIEYNGAEPGDTTIFPVENHVTLFQAEVKKKLSSKKRSSTKQTSTDMKRQRRLERNRASAQLSRERKKAHLLELEKKLQDLTSYNQQLKEQVASLTMENSMLKNQMHRVSCDDGSILESPPHPGISGPYSPEQPSQVPFPAYPLGAYSQSLAQSQLQFGSSSLLSQPRGSLLNPTVPSPLPLIDSVKTPLHVVSSDSGNLTPPHVVSSPGTGSLTPPHVSSMGTGNSTPPPFVSSPGSGSLTPSHSNLVSSPGSQTPPRPLVPSPTSRTLTPTPAPAGAVLDTVGKTAPPTLAPLRPMYTQYTTPPNPPALPVVPHNKDASLIPPVLSLPSMQMPMRNPGILLFTFVVSFGLFFSMAGISLQPFGAEVATASRTHHSGRVLMSVDMEDSPQVSESASTSFQQLPASKPNSNSNSKFKSAKAKEALIAQRLQQRYAKQQKQAAQKRENPLPATVKPRESSRALDLRRVSKFFKEVSDNSDSQTASVQDSDESKALDLYTPSKANNKLLPRARSQGEQQAMVDFWNAYQKLFLNPTFDLDASAAYLFCPLAMHILPVESAPTTTFNATSNVTTLQPLRSGGGLVNGRPSRAGKSRERGYREDNNAFRLNFWVPTGSLADYYPGFEEMAENPKHSGISEVTCDVSAMRPLLVN